MMRMLKDSELEKFFLRPEIKLPDCKLNDALDISFNMKGKVEAIYKM